MPRRFGFLSSFAWIAGLAVLISLAANASADAETQSNASVLDTPDQLEREKQALEVLASSEIRKRIDAVEKLFLANPRGATPAGRATARRAAESTAAAAAYSTVNDDVDRPVAFWGANGPHAWHGLKLPRAGYGIENPDNVYRHLHVDGASRYEIRGRFPKSGPVEQHYVVMESVPGDTKMQAEGSQMLSTLRSDAMKIEADGRFTIAIDADPPNGRANHIAIPRKGRYPIHIRDLFTDWATQDPVALEVTRVGGPPAQPPRSTKALIRATARRLDSMGPFWLAFNDQYIYTLPVNQIRPPRAREGGRGFSGIGHFALASGSTPADDEALVVTLDRLGAGSLGFQLTDPWGVAYEYVDRTSSLNQTQAVANGDGTYTFVVAARDPGVFNWLDPEGQSAGIFVVRWQVLPPGAKPEGGVRSVQVVKVGALRSALRKETRFVTPEERRTQRAQRAREFNRRLGL